MIAPVFVDTNVLVYAHDANEPAKQPLAIQWLGHLWAEQLGRTSTQVMSEYYLSLTRKIKPALPPDEAWDHVSTLRSWNPLPVDIDLLLRARLLEQQHQLNWCDCLVVGAAQMQNCALLLSEDLQDGAVLGGVTVRNPFTLGIAEAAAIYTAVASAGSHYRPRGRPKGRRRAVAAKTSGN